MTITRQKALVKHTEGMRFQTNRGQWFTIIDYMDCNNVVILFDIDSCTRVVRSKDILRGCLRSSNELTIAGVACVGYGDYKTSDKEGIALEPYKIFRKMIDRCYTEKYRHKNENYFDCLVDEKWHNYQNFAEWYYKQPGTHLKGFQLDKDLTKSRIYGEEFCYFIPREINSTLRIVSNKTNTELPRGVSLSKGSLPYVSTYREHRGGNLSQFGTVDEAREHYVVNTKRKLITIAKSYGKDIHPDVVKLLENYDWEAL